MYLNTTDERIRSNPHVLNLYQYLENSKIDLDNSELYYDFPLYKNDDDQIVVSQLMLVSPVHGIIIFSCSDLNNHSTTRDYNAVIQELDEVNGQIVSRLFKYRGLRKGALGLNIPVRACIIALELNNKDKIPDSAFDILTTKGEINNFFLEKQENFNEYIFSETISVIEGGKGLAKNSDRDLDSFDENSKVWKISAIESDILRFDRDQKYGYMPPLEGPQRIRGLAGSGKTVVLAMKVAQTILRNPNAKVLYTFHTKSLYQHVKRLITRFYRQFHDDDPDFYNKIHIRHAWGGKTNPGVYYEACLNSETKPLTLTEAKSNEPNDPFSYCCEKLLEEDVKPTYDYIFVDEAQDFNKNFLKLCLKLAINEKIILGADIFQNIFQAKVPTAKDILGEGKDFIEDKFLQTCYRTPLPVLVTAHAIGLGSYGNQVQRIDTKSHWNDLGYHVIDKNDKDDFDENELITVERPADKSPTFNGETAQALINANHYDDLSKEVNGTVSKILYDIQNEGVNPDDVLGNVRLS